MSDVKSFDVAPFREEDILKTGEEGYFVGDRFQDGRKYKVVLNGPLKGRRVMIRYNACGSEWAVTNGGDRFKISGYRV